MAGSEQAGLDARFSACEEQLRRAGHRLTTPRRVILRCVLEREDIFTAEELLSQARKVDPLISLATVYRTLPLLEEGGLLSREESESDTQHYRAGPPEASRMTLVCEDCGESVDLKDNCLDVRQRFLLKQMGFVARQMHLRVRAACERVHEGGRCEPQTNRQR